jgi:hypothetical protein
VVNVQESAQHVTPKVPPSRTMSMGAGGASSNSTPPGERSVYWTKCIGQSVLDKVDKESIFGTYLKKVVFCLQNKLSFWGSECWGVSTLDRVEIPVRWPLTNAGRIPATPHPPCLCLL